MAPSRSYYRLYLLVFSATSEKPLSLSPPTRPLHLLQKLAQTTPETTTFHAPFPPQLVPYATLLTSYPEFTYFLPDLASTSLSDPHNLHPHRPTLHPFSNYLTPFLAHWATTLFETWC